MKLRLVIFFIASTLALSTVWAHKDLSAKQREWAGPQPVVIGAHVWHNRVPLLIGDSPGYPGRRTWEITVIVTTEWWSNGTVSQTMCYNGRVSWRWYK